MKPRVVLADDYRSSLLACEATLQGTCNVVAMGVDGDSALEAIRRYKPEVAVLDVAMPGLTGMDVTRIAIQEQPSLGIVICTLSRDPAIIRAAADAGARGYVFKVNIFRDLADAVATVAKGGEFFPQEQLCSAAVGR